MPNKTKSELEDRINTLVRECEKAAARADKAEANMQSLTAIADGRIRHVFNGSCPDPVEGPSVRDDECPACKILSALDAAQRTA